jgi:O-antigen/teichoic acid export membrane protein
MLGTFFMFLNQLSSAFIMALGKFRVIMGVAVINLIVYLALAPWLIARHGATGAALATTAMEGLNTLMQLGVVYQLLRSAHAAHSGGSQSAR